METGEGCRIREWRWERTLICDWRDSDEKGRSIGTDKHMPTRSCSEVRGECRMFSLRVALHYETRIALCR
jgi:hypothetical protein